MRLVPSTLALSVALIAVGCIAPEDRRPGFRLPGEVVGYPADWSVVEAHPLIAVEVRTPYLLPHSVTITRGVQNGDLIIGARDPETKNWPGWVDDDPNVRLGIGDLVYEAKLVAISDPDEAALARSRATAQSGNPAALKDVPIRFWRVEPRDS